MNILIILMIANIIGVYLIVGVVSGFNISYRIGNIKKLDKKEFFLMIFTLPVSLPVLILSLIVILSFSRKKMLSNRRRKRIY